MLPGGTHGSPGALLFASRCAVGVVASRKASALMALAVRLGGYWTGVAVGGAIVLAISIPLRRYDRG
jgi:hypothetical protein